MKALVGAVLAMIISTQAQASISITVNNVTASADGADAQALIAEMQKVGVSAQPNTLGTNFSYSAYTLSGLVYSTPAACDKAGQSDTQLQALASVKEQTTTILQTFPIIDSPCGSSAGTGATAMTTLLSKYMTSQFQPDQGMSQSRYYFSVDCDQYSDGTYNCAVNLSNSDEELTEPSGN